MPSSVRARTLRAAVGAILMLPLMVMPADAHRHEADRGLESRRREAVRHVSRAEGKVTDSSQRFAAASRRLSSALERQGEAEAELAEVRRQVLTARARYDRVSTRLATVKDRLDAAREELATSQVAAAKQREEAGAMVAELYQGTDPRLLALNAYLGATSLDDVTRQLEVGSVLISEQTRAYDELRAAQILAEVHADTVEETAALAARRQDAAAGALADVTTAQQAARRALQEFDRAIAEQRAAHARAAQVRRRDLLILRRAEARELRIRSQIRRDARREEMSSQSVHGRPDAALLRPVQGVVTSPYGYRRHPIYGYWGLHDGIDYGAGCGQALVAGAAGVVSRTYYSDVYGYRLFLQVGSVRGRNLTLVYNHARGYNVGAGERVTRGQVIGAVGDSGWSTGCHLHFTVLADGTPVNPESWF